MRFLRSDRRTCVGLWVAVSWVLPLQSQAERNLADTSLEDLMTLEVTSVSRKPQLLSKSAAAVYVITQEDIARSGLTSIPEVLRMAPGLMVARIDANKWSVSARGDSGRFSNKMLVLIDGRTVYSQLYSGVYWEQNDTLLEDIERIEIIRGPGGTMWGANAVNAVINIITRSAKRTQGLMATIGAGTEDRGAGAVRYGGSAGENLYYRGYAKYFNRDSLLRQDGSRALDTSNNVRGGGRMEWTPTARDTVTVHGDLYRGEGVESIFTDFPLETLGNSLTNPVSTSGGYGLAKWEKALSAKSDTTLQAYFNRENRVEAMGTVANSIGDIDFQHHVTLGTRNDLLWGAGFRVLKDQVGGGILGASRLKPESRTDWLYSAFLQNDVSLVRDRLVVTAGTKLQHNSYTGVELQPGARVLWTPNSRQSFWASAARAVRTPSRLDRHLAGISFAIPPPAPAGSIGWLRGNPDLHSETMFAYEAGGRWQDGKRLSFDLAVFLGDDRGLRETVAGNPELRTGPVPHLLFPYFFYNSLSQKRGGIEATTMLQAARSWRLHANYSWCRNWDRHGDPAAVYPGFVRYREHQAQIRSSWDLPRRASVDVSVFGVSGQQPEGIPSNVRADVRFAKRFAESGEWSIGVRDALDRQHLEFNSEDYVRSSEAKRTFYFRVIWGR